mmetsp:Transcript_46204/g.100410  ORF Transcript_46204/g.100410 Transcript_46204/m.100410 type:complete len:201 (-) Transcript_46204:547-1149(-)
MMERFIIGGPADCSMATMRTRRSLMSKCRRRIPRAMAAPKSGPTNCLNARTARCPTNGSGCSGPPGPSAASAASASSKASVAWHFSPSASIEAGSMAKPTSSASGSSGPLEPDFLCRQSRATSSTTSSSLAPNSISMTGTVHLPVYSTATAIGSRSQGGTWTWLRRHPLPRAAATMQAMTGGLATFSRHSRKLLAPDKMG